MSSISIRKIAARETWELRRQVMWPDKPLDFVKLKEDEAGLHYGLFDGVMLCSVISVFVNAGEAQFRKFATRESEQGKGHGTRLLGFVMKELETEHRIWCNARLDKASFYERFGLRVTNQFFEKEGISYVVMEKWSVEGYSEF